MLFDIIVFVILVFLFIQITSFINRTLTLHRNPYACDIPSTPQSEPVQIESFESKPYNVIGKIREPHAGSAGEPTFVLLDAEPYLIRNNLMTPPNQ